MKERMSDERLAEIGTIVLRRVNADTGTMDMVDELLAECRRARAAEDELRAQLKRFGHTPSGKTVIMGPPMFTDDTPGKEPV